MSNPFFMIADPFHFIKKNETKPATTAELEKLQTQGVDIFYTQQQMVDALDKVLMKQQAETAGTVYVQPQEIQKPTNYVMYLGIAAAALAIWYFFLRK